jgi:phosphate transport system substrate-binding protein
VITIEKILIFAGVLLIGCFIPNRWVRRICGSLLTLIGLCLGGFLLALMALSTLGYGSAWALLPLGAGVFFVVLLAIWRPFSQQTRRTVCLSVAGAVLVVAGVLAGPEIHRAMTPTVDEGVNLFAYNPFDAGSRLAQLAEPATLTLTDDLPRLDGATALYPVYAAFAQAVYPEGEYSHYYSPEYSSVICSSTAEAYENLMAGTVDMIFVAGPSQAQLAQAESFGVTLNLTPIGREAFVFMVNRGNPVKSLAIAQLQGIYTGEITNWRDVGGKNAAIRAFQRPENSGSQTALENFLEGLPLMPAPTEDKPTLMGMMMDAVADFRNYSTALGYTFRYYAETMNANARIRLLAVDGVAPTPENMRNGTYPLTADFYAITAAGAPEEGARAERMKNAEALLQWVLSPQGQSLIDATGYVSLSH